MQKRKEPPENGMTVKAFGKDFARKELLKRISGVNEGQTVELDWKTSNGLTVSKVGTVIDTNVIDENSIDITIRTNGPTDNCYLHINTHTRDVFFTDDSRKTGRRKLLLFNPR